MALEMISLKSQREIEAMRRAGRITAQARALAGSMVRPGVSTHEIDRAVRRFIESHGAKPSFLGYGGFPASACISINEEVIHGIPGPRKLKEGDIVSVDIVAYKNGFHGDCCRTFAIGEISEEKKKLVRVTEECFWKGIEGLKAGTPLYDISYRVQSHAESNGFSVIRSYTGHGIGREMHEDPSVPNFGRRGTGVRLQAGTVICVEPMIAAGGWKVKVLPDGWTAVTADRKSAAHYENTLVVREDGVEILTL